MRTVVLSKKASQKLEELLEYLETEWSAKVKEDFIVKLDKSLYLIKQFPFGSFSFEKRTSPMCSQ
jgi:plasmid stabilization system protein ParE